MSTPPDGPAPNPEPNPPGPPSRDPNERREEIRPDRTQPRSVHPAGDEFPYDPSADTGYSQRPATDMPGMFLIVLGALSILGGIFMCIRAVWIGVTPIAQIQAELDETKRLMPGLFAGQNLDAGEVKVQSVVTAAGMGGFGLISSALMILGGIRMRQCRSYALAMTASIVAMVPCLTCAGCCGAGQGVGIWALVVLLRPEVQALFKSAAQETGGGVPM